MAVSNISSIGRFSSQMLTNLGTQRSVQIVPGSVANVFKYATGPVTFPSPGSVTQATLGTGVVGSYSLADYNSVTCYFLSRGSSQVYADTMTALTIDMASVLGITPASLLAQSEVNGQTALPSGAYTVFNMLRDPSHQVGIVTTVSNKYSLQANQIRP